MCALCIGIGKPYVYFRVSHIRVFFLVSFYAGKTLIAQHCSQSYGDRLVGRAQLVFPSARICCAVDCCLFRLLLISRTHVSIYIAHRRFTTPKLLPIFEICNALAAEYYLHVGYMADEYQSVLKIKQKCKFAAFKAIFPLLLQ